MNKNIENLSFEIGKLFFNNTGRSSIGKTDDLNEFSSCLSKLTGRENKSSIQNDRPENGDVVEKKTNDDTTLNNSINKVDVERNTKKSEDYDKADALSETATDDDADTKENEEAEVNAVGLVDVLNNIINPDLQNVSDTDNVAVQASVSNEVMTQTVEAVAVNSGIAETVEVSLNTADIDVITENFSDVVSNIEQELQSGVSEPTLPVTDFSGEIESNPQSENNPVISETMDNVMSDSVNVLNQNAVKVENTALTSENIMLDSNVSVDIVSVNISSETNVQTAENTDNIAGLEKVEIAATLQAEGTNVVADASVDAKMKVDNVRVSDDKKITENTAEVELNSTEQTETVVDINATEQGESENSDLGFDQTDEFFDTNVDISERGVDFDTDVVLNSRVDFRATVDLSNASTRNVNAAQAVQNTIVQNMNDMVGRMESKSMELILNPENLGKIVIRMQSTIDGLNIKIVADNLEINKGLEMRIFQIENTIKAQGVNLNNIEIEHASVSDNNSSGFMNPDNLAQDFEGTFAQNQNSDRSSREEYIEYTEYTYDAVDGTEESTASEGMWRSGNHNVEFLA